MQNKLTAFAAQRGISVDVARQILSNGPCGYLPKELRTDATFELVLFRAQALGIDPMSGDIRASTFDGYRVSIFLSTDGFLRIANSHPEFDGLQIEVPSSEEWVDIGIKTLGRKVTCPSWVSVAIHRKDRKVPTIVREYLDECYSSGVFDEATGTFADGPWQRSPKRQLTNRAICSAVRIAFGIVGVSDAVDIPADASAKSNAKPDPDENPDEKNSEPTAAPVVKAVQETQSEPSKGKETTTQKGEDPDPDPDPIIDVTETTVAKLIADCESLTQKQKKAELDDVHELMEQPKAKAKAQEAEQAEKVEATSKSDSDEQIKVANAIAQMWGFVRSGALTLEQAKAWCLSANLSPNEESRVIGQINMELLAK